MKFRILSKHSLVFLFPIFLLGQINNKKLNELNYDQLWVKFFKIIMPIQTRLNMQRLI